MYAIVESGGRQYRAEAGHSFSVEKLDHEVGAQIELNNVLGQRVYQTKLSDRTYWRKEFDMTSYVKGIYMLRISTDKGVLQRRIVID